FRSNLNTNILVYFFGLFAFCIILYGIYKLMHENKNKLSISILFSLYLSFLLIIFLLLISNQHGPLAQFYAEYLKTGLPDYIYLFGILSGSFIILFIAILLPISLAISFNYSNKFIHLIIIAIIIIFYLYSFAYLPISNGYEGYLKNNETMPNGVMNIPKYVFEISDFINHNLSSSYAVLTLPQTDYAWELSRWYNGSDVYGSLINGPVYTGYFGFTAYGEYWFPQSMNLAYLAGKEVDNSTLTNLNVDKLFELLGIKYIIVQGDTIKKSNFIYIPASIFNFSKIYFNLNSSKGLAFVKSYGNSSIYVNNNLLPLVYSTNLIYSKNLTPENLVSFIIRNDSNFNPSNYSIYTKEIQGFGDSGGPYFGENITFNYTPTNISNYIKPDVSFVQNTPTSVTVHVTNATTPYYLVFRETYDPHWAAFYSNGTQVNPRNHIAVNGFANAWYMNKTGNYTITLYYTLQTDAWIAWGVSFAAFFVTVGIGVYGWREMRHAREVK
ncbi:MAG: hypothetical protein QXG73_03655, partial [Candidatus Micrarchaeaceae archaeon]